MTKRAFKHLNLSESVTVTRYGKQKISATQRKCCCIKQWCNRSIFNLTLFLY